MQEVRSSAYLAMQLLHGVFNLFSLAGKLGRTRPANCTSSARCRPSTVKVCPAVSCSSRAI